MSVNAVLFIAFVIVIGLQVVYYITFLIAFRKKKPTVHKINNTPVSVLICAKNESENLKKHLPYILNQSHPNFEIVLINDSSYDDTLEVMNHFKASNSTIKIVDVKSNETFWGNKKYALTLGIKAASYETLVFTDADCKPNSTEWLRELTHHFSEKTSIVLGYGAYIKKPWSFLNLLIRFETVLTAIQYLSYANLGFPYMGVGRNMAYKKELFFKNNGFSNHMMVKSGDDDLFINEVANTANTTVCISKASFTLSNPKTTLKDWFRQKRRHISTSSLYKTKHKIILGLFYLSQIMFWILGIALIILGYDWQWLVGLIGLRILIQQLSFGFAAKKLDELNLIFLLPILELFLIVIQLSIFIANKISTPTHWK